MTENKNENQAVPALKTHAELAESGLTKRNQEFMWQVQSAANDEQINAGLVAEIESNLLEAQKSGATAKQIYGTPENALGIKTKEVQQSNSAQQASINYAANGFWKIAVDNSFVFFMMFSLMFGIMLLFSAKQVTASGQNVGQLGVTALILTSITGGVFFAGWTMLMAPNADGQRRGVIIRILGSLAIFAAWFGCYMGFGFLPAVINPLLPGWIYLVLAGLSFLGFQWWRRKTGMQGGFLGGAGKARK
ncbi:DUF1129 family protein [Weissella viridescens]|uniref:DUF1129 family protein n=1 Tax=Weissella viridescens TaxID=1629 RepID=UPI003AF259C0